MKPKLKTLSDLASEEGPFYNRIKIALKIWEKAYNKRGFAGDKAVIKFIKHFGELDNSLESKNG